MSYVKVPATNDKAERLRNLNEHITFLVYENVSRSLFERHKILLSLSLALKVRLIYFATCLSTCLFFFSYKTSDKTQAKPQETFSLGRR